MLVCAVLAVLCCPAAASAAPTISTVAFGGDASNPRVTITGSGFGSEPPATNPAYQSSGGYDYGNALYVCDLTPNPNKFCAGQNDGSGHGSDTVGLVVSTYTDSEIVYTLGSDYNSYYYPSNMFRLQQGDQFSVHVNGATCGGAVDYSGNPISCTPPAPPSSGCPAAQGAHAATAAAPGSLGARADRSGAISPARKRARRPRALYRVFASGPNEIAVPPRKPFSAAFYHFQIAASRPFPRTAPQVHLDPVAIDSGSRRVFLRFTSPGCPDVLLTGTFPRTRLKVAAKRRSFRLALSIPLTNLVTGARAGTMHFNVRGTIPPHVKAAHAAANGGGPGIPISLSGGLDFVAGVISHAPEKSKIAKAAKKLPAIQKGGGGRPGNSPEPVGSTYTGTADGLPISIELTDDKTSLKHLDVSTPEFACITTPSPLTELFGVPFSAAGDSSLKLHGPVEPNGVVAGTGNDVEKYVTGGIAGRYYVSLTAAFAPSFTAGGVTVQHLGGSYTIVIFITSGTGRGATCIHTAFFSANVVATSE